MSTQKTDALQCAADLEYSIPRHRIQDAFILNAYKALKMIRTQHARIADLEAQLEAIGTGGVQALSAAPAEQEEAAQRLRKTLDIDPGDVNDPLHPRYIAGFKSGHAAGRRRAAPAASPTPTAEQASPKAAPGVGNSGFDHKTAADFLNGKTVSDEAVRKFVAASRWAHDERAALSATLLAMHGVLTSREAEIALLKKALMEAEAVPQQEAQEPVAWLNPWRADQVTTDYDAYGERGIPLYTAPRPAPVPLSDDVVKDVRKALDRAFIMGQNYWADADSESFTANKRSNVTRQKFNTLRDEVCAALAAQGGK